MTIDTSSQILREDVPTALAESARTARAFLSGSATMADILVNDTRLRDLISAVDREHRDLPHTGLRTREIEDITYLRNGVVQAIAPMAFCPESVLIVHGPIMLGRIAALAEHVLPGRQLPRAFKNVRFFKPVVQDVVMRIAPSKKSLSDKPSVSGELLDDRGDTWYFSVAPIPERVVTRWIDNRSVREAVDISSDPEEPVRHFHWSTSKSEKPRMAQVEAIQTMIETISRTIVAHRSLDGRAILLTGIEHLTWPLDLADQFANDASAEVKAMPGELFPGSSSWHQLNVKLFGDFGEGEIVFAEGRTTLTELFKSVSMP